MRTVIICPGINILLLSTPTPYSGVKRVQEFLFYVSLLGLLIMSINFPLNWEILHTRDLPNLKPFQKFKEKKYFRTYNSISFKRLLFFKNFTILLLNRARWTLKHERQEEDTASTHSLQDLSQNFTAAKETAVKSTSRMLRALHMELSSYHCCCPYLILICRRWCCEPVTSKSHPDDSVDLHRRNCVYSGS